MNDEFENQLRRALRPVEAPEGFAERLLQKLPAQPAPQFSPVVVPLPARPQRTQRRYGLPAALAASMVAAVLLGQQFAMHRMERQEAAGRAASQELLQALRVTSQKLDMAYQAVNSPPRSERSETDEENPS